MAALKESSEDFPNNCTAAKSVSVKNRRVACKWQQLVKAIEEQKSVKYLELNENRSKLLSQREETNSRTASIANKKLNNEKSSLQSVCAVLLASVRENKQCKANTDGTSFQKPTRSSEKKKVARKNVSLSLQDLRKAPQNTREGFEQRTAVQTTTAEDNTELSCEKRRPKSAFDLTEEEEEISRKLYSSPLALPRIHLQKSFRPKYRSFAKDGEYRKRTSIDEEAWKDIHHYRYLRLKPLRRSSTAPDLKQAFRS